MRVNIQTDVPLAPLTTLGVGGPARFFARIREIGELEEAVAFATNRDLPVFIMGGGSNLVIADRGWPGLVIKIETGGIVEQHENGRSIFSAGAGVDWDEFVAHCVSRRCAGIECLSGIPGTVGGTPVQNVGAYGQEVSETIVSVLAFDLADHRARDLTAADCGFAYRTSIFNTTQRGRYIILQVSFALMTGGSPAVRYGDLQSHFAGRSSAPALAEVREAVRQIRARKGMLITPGDPDSRSAGSFFKNPVLSPAEHGELVRRAAERGLQVPGYPALTRHHKVPAAWLVEHSGFSKGYAKGRAAISSKHALAIVNRGGASADEIIALKNEIQSRVEQAWDIRLTPEPVFAGF